MDYLASYFANQKPKWHSHCKKSYHSLSRGFIENEIFRRVDPKKRTIGQFFREEVAIPLHLTASLGVPKEMEPLVSPLHQEPPSHTLKTLVLPFLLGKFGKLDKWTHFVMKSFMDKTSLLTGSIKFVGSTFDVQFINSAEFHAVEAPSYGGFTNAKSLAKLGCVLARGGKFDGVSLLSDAGYKRAMEHDPTPVLDHCVGLTSSLTSAGFGKNFDVLEDLDKEWYGWSGMGGSLFLWNPKYDISFAYTMNAMGHYGAVDIRAFVLAQAVDEIVKNIENAKVKTEVGSSRLQRTDTINDLTRSREDNY